MARSAEGAVGPAAGHRLGRIEMSTGWCLGALALLAAWLHPVWGTWVEVHCPLLVLAGVPCPSCGATRAMVAAASGHWMEALAWNPAAGAVGISLPLLLPLGAAWLVSGRPGPRVPEKLSPGLRRGVGVLFVLHWSYLCLWFPA